MICLLLSCIVVPSSASYLASLISGSRCVGKSHLLSSKRQIFLELMNLKLFLLIFFLSNMGKQKVNDTWLENSIFSFCFKPWKIKVNPLMQKHKQKTLQKFYLVKPSETLEIPPFFLPL